MPVAKADGEDVIIDQIINSLSAVDPTAALDMTSWLSNLDAALQGAANFDPSSLAGAMPDIDSVELAAATRLRFRAVRRLSGPIPAGPDIA